MEELTRSHMESPDITELCLALLQQLKRTLPSQAPVFCGVLRKEFLVCLQCRRCLTGSCLHCSEPVAEQDVPTLDAILNTAAILEELQVKLELGFELAVGDKLLYVWEITHQLPEIPPERCCQECKAPLPRSPGDNSRPWVPILRDQCAPQGQRRSARQDTRALLARQTWPERRDAGSADLQPAGQGWSGVPAWPLSQMPPAIALAWLHRAGMEPLPWVVYRGLGQGVSLQHLQQSWSKAKNHLQRSVRAKWGQQQRARSSAPNDTAQLDQTLPFELGFKVHAFFNAMAMDT